MNKICQKDKPIVDITFELINEYLNDSDYFEYQFTIVNSLIIKVNTLIDSNENKVKCIEVSYQNLVYPDAEYEYIGRQYFAPSEINNAIIAFLERLQSEEHFKKTQGGKSLNDIHSVNEEILKYCSEDNKPKDESIKKAALMAIRTYDVFYYTFSNKDIITINKEIVSNYDVKDIACLSITYYTFKSNSAGEDVYQDITTEYFLKKDIDLAIDVFIEKLNSDRPSFITGRGKELKDINISNTGMLSFNNHYDYLEVMIEPFWIQVFNKTPNEMWFGGIIGAHGDKGFGYKIRWEEAGISYPRGMLIYLLTWTTELGDTAKSESGDWVIEKYKHYLPMIEQAEKQVLREKYGVV